MPTAETISIGTEILLGEILDTNARFIARELRDIGVDLYRQTTIGDNVKRIAEAIRQALERADIIITTGGLGPTVDDPTREAVALAIGVGTEFRPELWEQIQSRFQRYGRKPTENNRRQAYIPKGAIPVENPVGTAPAFIVRINGQTIFSLPGVPSEMETLMKSSVLPYLCHNYQLRGVIKRRVLHTAGVGESQIDEVIGDLERLSNPTVGLAAHSGQVDVRITAKADSEAEADAMIAEIEDSLRQRLGHWIYGADQETLEHLTLQSLEKRGWTLAVVEAGLGGGLINHLASEPGPFQGGQVLSRLPSQAELMTTTAACRDSHQAQIGLGVALVPGLEKQDIYMALITPQGERQIARSYGGPPDYAPTWAINHSLDLIRNL